MRVIIDASHYGSWGPLDPRDPEGQPTGGSERGMIELALGLSAKGHEVIVSTPVAQPGLHHGVLWLPPEAAHGWSCDVLVLHGMADSTAERYQAGRVVAMANWCDLVPEADAYVVWSQIHADALHHWHGVPRERLHVIPMGVHLDAFPPTRKVKGRVVYCSSPDRGLHHLLHIWPEVRKQVPHAELRIGYAVKRWCEQVKWKHYIDGDVAWQILEGLKQPGVVLLDALPHREMVRELCQAEVFAYPCDPIDLAGTVVETFCLAALEAAAARCALVLSDCEAVGELHAPHGECLPLPVYDGVWVEAIVKALTDDKHRKALQRKARAHAEAYPWSRMVAAWEALLTRVCTEQLAEVA